MISSTGIDAEENRVAEVFRLKAWASTSSAASRLMMPLLYCSGCRA